MLQAHRYLPSIVNRCWNLCLEMSVSFDRGIGNEDAKSIITD